MKAWFGFHIHSLEMTVTSILWVWSSISNVKVSKASKKNQLKIITFSFFCNKTQRFDYYESQFFSTLSNRKFAGTYNEINGLKKGNFILIISVIRLFTSDLGARLMFLFEFIWTHIFSPNNKEFLSLTARAGWYEIFETHKC